MTKKDIYRLWPLFLIIILFFLFYYFNINHYLTFSFLKLRHQQLIAWTNTNYFSSVLLFMTCYIICVAASFPGAIILTLTGGLLFGIFWGTIFVVSSATIGSILIFLTVRYALSNWVAKRTSEWVKKMRLGFQENAFTYLLVLRLIPVFPFWVVNIVPALLGVELKTFTLATFVGIIPASIIYTSIGSSLNHLFESEQAPNLGIIFSPEFLLPLLGLAVLSIIPVVFKKFRGRNGKSN